MRKRLLILFLIIAFITTALALSACGCKHKDVEWVITQAATCTATGVKTLVCRNCKEILDADTIPTTPHTEVAAAALRAASCTAEGMSGGTYCSVCLTIIQPPQAIPTLSHMDNDHDCLCDVCNSSMHEYGDWNIVKESSCMEEGRKERRCIKCDSPYAVESEAIPKAAHTIKNVNEIEAACTANGLSAGTVCEICGENIGERQVLAALGHDFVDGECARCHKTDDYCRYLKYQLNAGGDYYEVIGFADGAPVCASLVIPSTYNGKLVKAIGIGAFEGEAITSLEIPFSIERIGDYAFKNCADLHIVTFEENSRLSALERGIFEACSTLENIELPPGLTQIKCAFTDCVALKSMHIGAAVYYIADDVFSTTSIESFTVDENNSYFKAIDGNLYTSDSTLLLAYAIGKSDTSFTVPPRVEIIAGGAFANAAALREIIFSPDGKLYTISDFAFAATSITSVVIPASVFEIGSNAFMDCFELVEVRFEPDGICKRIEGYAFSGCTALTSFVVPEEIEEIGNNIFNGASQVVVYVPIAENEVPSGWSDNWSSGCTVNWNSNGN